MVRREIKFRLVEGDFETWKSLVPWIEKICENNAGHLFTSSIGIINKTCIAEN